MRQASGGFSTGATGTGISLGANLFRLLRGVGAIALGRPTSARDMARLVAQAHVLTRQLLGSGRGARSFRTCLRVGLRVGLRIGLALFCVAIGLGVGLGLCVWLVGQLLVGLVVFAGRLIGAPVFVLRVQANDVGQVERQRHPRQSGQRSQGHSRRTESALFHRWRAARRTRVSI